MLAKDVFAGRMLGKTASLELPFFTFNFDLTPFDKLEKVTELLNYYNRPLSIHDS